MTSFRDPAGQLLSTNGRILRFIKKSAADDLHEFLSSATAQKFTQLQCLVRTAFLDAASIQSLTENLPPQVANDPSTVVVEHERIRFPSFPYEWPPEMLHAAGSLTLDLAEDLLAEGWGLKDATPYNVLFNGPNPVFVDLLSFERRDPTDPIWTPYAQFVRTFLLPLMANKHFGLRLDELLITHRDGLEPNEIYRLSSFLQKLRPEFVSLVSLPNWLSSSSKSSDKSIYEKRNADSPEQARFVLAHLIKRLRKKLGQVAPETIRHSTWSGYMAENRYTEDYFPEKERFVQEAIAEWQPKTVLDVGCNTGHFSALAASSGASVIAIDYDPVVCGAVWRRAREEHLNVLPLVVDLTRPTPSVGWRNAECSSFLDRARGSFDAVLMLAVIHHMLVSEQIPLLEILQLAAEITTNLLVVEFVAPDDEMFHMLTRGRDHLHEDLTLELFESTARRFFIIERSAQLGQSSRWIYLLSKRGVGGRA